MLPPHVHISCFSSAHEPGLPKQNLNFALLWHLSQLSLPWKKQVIFSLIYHHLPLATYTFHPFNKAVERFVQAKENSEHLPSLSSFLKILFILILETERGRKKKIYVREKHLLACPLFGDQSKILGRIGLVAYCCMGLPPTIEPHSSFYPNFLAVLSILQVFLSLILLHPLQGGASPHCSIPIALPKIIDTYLLLNSMD